MKTILYYFSATGNSLVVARDLATALGNASVEPLGRALSGGPERTADAVGIVFPVYMFGLPLIVADFLRAVPLPQEAYVFTVATYGGLQGRPHTLARRILAKRDRALRAGFSVRMPGNYTPLYGAIPLQQQERMFASEKERVSSIAERVAARAHVAFEEKPRIRNFLLSSLVYRAGSGRIPESARGFWITSACTKCGLCAKVCPAGNVELREGQPVWLDHCQHCMACLQWCPVEAIQYKKSTQGKKRYRHPQVTAQDIMGFRRGQ